MEIENYFFIFNLLVIFLLLGGIIYFVGLLDDVGKVICYEQGLEFKERSFSKFYCQGEYKKENIKEIDINKLKSGNIEDLLYLNYTQ